MKISTSILSSLDRIQSIKKLNNTNTDYIHIDVMDGIFVPNTQFTIEEINNIKKYSNKKIDIHLMVEDPIKYIENIEKSNVEFITIHQEINKDINKIIEKIKSYNIKVGLSIKPNTNIEKIIPYLNIIDMILVMSVEPGFGGQKFIDNTIEKINQIKDLKQEIIIEVDGGINNTNINKLKPNTDIAVIGSFITNKENYNEAINILKN